VQPTQTDVLLHQAEATRDLTLYQNESATQQFEGKPRCISPMFKLLAPMFMYLCIKARRCFETLIA
jgi:hypothetical protein